MESFAPQLKLKLLIALNLILVAALIFLGFLY